MLVVLKGGSGVLGGHVLTGRTVF